MVYTLEDFERDVRKEQFSKLPLEEQVEFATQLPEKCRVQIASGLPPEVLKKLLEDAGKKP